MDTNDITYFGKTNFRGQEHVFGIKRDDRRRHMYVIGKTGMGKTTLLENMIISDIINGNGLAVVDPHGDLAEEILNFIPPHRVNDVVYFNPADIDYPIAFNVMEHVDPKYRHLVASGLIGVFKKIWADSWGPRLEYLLRNAILGLLEYPDSTLLGVTRMLVDEDYRRKVVSKISDPVVKSFWNDEFTKYSKQFMVEAIAPIQNKVGQFLSSSLVRNIVAQSHSSIDMRDIMDNQKIFIINLAKGRIGEDYSALLGAMLITKIQLAAMGRVDTPEPDRKDFYLYVDEFQNFATESFAGILSEARKYRLDLIVAHQYIGQLEETVRDAIFGNVGTIVTFRVGATDAEYLEKEFEPIFMMNDLVNLAKYEMYLKLMIDGVSGDAFSADSMPPIQIAVKSDPEKIIKVSRERYTKKREIVEDKVARWSGYVRDEENDEWVKDESAGRESTPRRESAPKPDNREMWNATCAVCGTEIKVPFQPDPSRQTYCKDCLAKVRKQMADVIKTPEETAAQSQAPQAPRSQPSAPAARPEERPAPRREERAAEPVREVVRQETAPQVLQGEISPRPQARAASAPSDEMPPRPAPQPAASGQEPQVVKFVQHEVRAERKTEITMAQPQPSQPEAAPAYDPQKMIELLERRRREAEEGRKKVEEKKKEALPRPQPPSPPKPQQKAPQPARMPEKAYPQGPRNQEVPVAPARPVQTQPEQRQMPQSRPQMPSHSAPAPQSQEMPAPKPAQPIQPEPRMEERKPEAPNAPAPSPTSIPLAAKELREGEVVRFDQ